MLHALTATLGVEDVDLHDETLSFIRLGGDSLTAVRLIDLIQSAVHVSIPASFLLDPRQNLLHIVRYMSEHGSKSKLSKKALSFNDIHANEEQVYDRSFKWRS